MRKAARLHRAGSARRPLRHGRRAQAHHPRPRDGPASSSWRTCRSRAWCRAGLESGSHRRVPGAPAAATMRAMRERFEAARAPRQGAALRRPARRADGKATVGLVELDAHARVRQHRAHRQRRALRDAPLLRQSADRAGPGRRARSHRGRRVRRPAARSALISERGCEHARRDAPRRSRRRRSAMSPSASTSSASAVDALGDRVTVDAHGAAGRQHQRASAASSAICRSSRRRTPPGARCSRMQRSAEARLRLRAGDRQGHSAGLGARRLGGFGGRARWWPPMRCCRQPLHASSSC